MNVMDQSLNRGPRTPIFDIFVILRISRFFIIVIIRLLVLLFGVARFRRENPGAEIFKFPFGSGIGESRGTIAISSTPYATTQTQLILALTQL